MSDLRNMPKDRPFLAWALPQGRDTKPGIWRPAEWNATLRKHLFTNGLPVDKETASAWMEMPPEPQP